MVFFYDAETYRGLTSPAPSGPAYPAQWHSCVKDIRVLYSKQHYKRCISECEKVLQQEAGRLSPLHATFLHFYIAICNESLGLAAHKSSSKKLSFLHIAKDAFIAALLSLPLSYVSEEHGDHTTTPSPPHAFNTDHVDDEHDKERIASHSSEPAFFQSIHSSSETHQSLHERCDSGYDSDIEFSPIYDDKVPDFNSYSARQTLALLASQNQVQPKPYPGYENTKNTNLGDLIPRPLSIKKKANTHSNDTSSPSPLPSTTHSLTQQSKHPPPKPSTAHSSHQNFNTSLTSFQTHLTNHLTTINTTIATATHLQNQHRLNQSKRLASFWSFEPIHVSRSEDRASGPDNNKGKDEGVKDTNGDEDEKAQRIRQLRASGFKVTKARHGFKGLEYYEQFRRRALEELALPR